MSIIENINNANRMLAKAQDLTSILKIRDIATAAQAYANARGADEASQMALKLKLRSERKAGQFLKETELNKGAATPRGDIMSQRLPTLAELGVLPQESKRWQQIASIPEEEFETYLNKAETRSQSALISAAKNVHVSNNSGEFEWYTPIDYIEAAKLTMGTIDLDPASCDAANETIKAKTYYTEEQDGLIQPWFGNVWLNPPYSQPLVSQFCDLLVDNYLKDNIKQACVLVNNATETKFYQNMLNHCSAVCFIKGRVKFVDKNGESKGSPLQGQTVLYFGKETTCFVENFSYFGATLYA